MRNTSQKPRVHVAIFDAIPDADRAISQLVEAGIPKEHITVICPAEPAGKYPEMHREAPAGSRATVAAAAGGSIGALLGGLVAVAGITATGGASLFVAGSLLAGTSGGAVFGGFVGAMMTRGMEREVADFYDQALDAGRILVAVEASDEVTSEQIAAADRIFAAAGAERVLLRKT